MAKSPSKKRSDPRGRKGARAPDQATSRSDRGKEIQKLKKRFKKDPTDEGAFVKLWDVYLENEAWEAMVDLLQKRIEMLGDEREKVRSLIKLGSLYDEKLLDARRAVDTFHRVLTLDPQNRRAIWALGMLYHDLEDWEKVIEIYLLRISLAQSPEEKLALRSQLAQIYEQRLQQEDQALMEYIRAARLAPQNVRVLLNMEKLATRTESFRELLAVYEDVVERIERVELRIALYLKLARLYTEHLDDDERTSGYYRRAIELSGGDPEKLFSISNIYGEEEEWDELIATYTQLIRHAKRPQIKSRIRREISRLYRDGLQDTASAFFELVRVARYDPEEEGLIDELIGLGTASEKHLELAAVLEDIGSRLADPAQKASLYTRLARLHLDDLHNADMAREAVFKALEESPSHVPAQIVRFDLLEAGKEFEILAQSLESFLSRPDLSAEVAKEQRLRLARICEDKLNDRERAVELFRETLREPPQEGAPQPEQREEILEELYRRQGTWEELVSLLTKRISKTSDSRVRVEAHLEIAEIYRKNLGQADQAFFELVRAVRHAPGNPKVLDELFRVGQETGFRSELLAVMDDLCPVLEDPAVASIQSRIGALLLAEGDLPGATEHFQRALDLDGSQELAYRNLRDILQSRDEIEALVEMDLRRASLIPDRDEKLELLFGAAENLEDRLASDGRAADVYDRILSLDPGSTAAQKALSRLRGEAARIATFDEGPTHPGTRPPAREEEDEDTDVFKPVRIDSAEDRDLAEVISPTRRRRGKTLPEEEEVATVFSPPRRPEKEDEPPSDGASPAGEEPLLPQDREPTAVGPAPYSQPSAREVLQPRDREPTLVSPPPGRKAEAASVEPAPEVLTPVAPAPGEPEPEEPTPVAPAPGEPEPEEPTPVAPAPDEAAAAEPAPLPPPPPTDEAAEEEEIDSTPMEEEPTAKTEIEDPITQARQRARNNPGDPEAWESLASLLQGREGAPEAFQALQDGLPLMRDEECQSRVYRRMSLLAGSADLRLRLGLLLEESGRIEDAESSFRAVIREDAAHREALDGLYRIYASRQALDRFDAILTRTLGAATDSQARRTLLLRRARLRADELDRQEAALADLEQLVSVEGGDLEALTFQEAILERTGRHEHLVKAYERHLDLCESAADRVDLHLALAILYENRLDNADRAMHCYRQALKEDPAHLGALDSLVTMLERKRDWLGAIGLIEDAVQHIEDASLLGQFHLRRGQILEEQLLRPEDAEEAYRRAIEADSGLLAALSALKGIARRRADWVEVIRLAGQILQVETDAQRSAELQVEMARIWRDKLENTDKATQCFEEACALDPDNLEAARVVADARLKGRRHEEAHELLERLTRLGAAKDMDPQELAAIHLKLAQTAEALDRPDQAGEAFERALELSPTDHPILTQYGYHLARHERWDRAVELYREILDRYRHKLEPNEVADIHCLMAQGFVKLEQPDEAALNYRQALKANPRHLPALRALVDLSRQLGRHEEEIGLLSQLREYSPSPASRFRLSMQMGDVFASQLDKPAEAAEAYEQALAEEANNVEVLEKLRRVLVRAERYPEAVSVLERLAHLSPGDRQRARFLRIAGDIERERLDDDTRALEFYLRALRFAPLDKRAHGAAVKILNRMRAWPRLTSLYEELLQRLPPPIAGQEDRRQPILTELVELYRYRLNDNKRAIRACEQLLAIAKGNLKVREDLARLYETEGRFDDAAAIHRSLIADSPFSVDSYHALRRLYEHRGQRDRTLCMAATLAFLDEANEDELRIWKQNRHAMGIPPGRRLTENLYNRMLLHPHAGGLLGEMFSFAADHCRDPFVVDHREYKLKPRDRLNLGHVTSKIVSTLKEALIFLGLPPPEVFGKGVTVKGILAVNTSPPAVLYSEESLRRASIPELRFMVGRAIAFTRPENLLAASLSPKQLRMLLEALVEVAFPSSQVHPVSPEVASLARKCSKLIPRKKTGRLHQLASRFREQAEDLSIRDWLEGVEHTCNRAGFALCGDLEACVQVLKTARVVSPTGSSRSLIRELIFYSISDSYFEIRQALDAAIH